MTTRKATTRKTAAKRTTTRTATKKTATKRTPAKRGTRASGPTAKASQELKRVKEEAKAAAAAERKAAAEAKKAAAEAARIGAHETAIRKLEPIAKEINVRLTKAAKSEDDAWDHRLAAALRLEEAKQSCKKAKIPFKTWCEEHVTQSYETVRKLAAVGGSDNPPQALEDMRHKNKQANKKLRDKKKSQSAGAISGPSGPKKSAWQQADEAVDALDDKKKQALVEAHASTMGLSVVSKTDAEALAKSKANKDDFSLAGAKAIFDGLSPKDKLALMEYACDQTGYKLVSSLDEPASEDEGSYDEIPANLDRRTKKPAAKRTRTRRKAA